MEEAIQSSVFLTSPDTSGWLNKRGFHWRKLWKQRWVALHGAEIAYMNKQPSAENVKSIVLTKEQITSKTEVTDEDPEGNPLGFTIHITTDPSLIATHPPWFLRAESAKEKKNWMIRLNYTCAIVRWLESFEKVRVLGVGGTGIVYELKHKTNGQAYALKEIEIKNHRQRDMAISEAEMLKDIMENVSHPSIMHIEKVFQVGSKFYLVFPLCTGGELFEHIVRKGHFTERDAAVILYDLISGLHALHEHDILHLDIKPENILFDGVDDNARIKITDFGISRLFSDSSNIEQNKKQKEITSEELFQKLREYKQLGSVNIQHVKGTIGYMSPELILCNYSSKAADIFASGVVLYILLNGRPPFAGENDLKVLDNTLNSNYNQSNSRWKSISENARDLIRRMLEFDPFKRIKCEEILKHPWITELIQSDSQSNIDQISTILNKELSINELTREDKTDGKGKEIDDNNGESITTPTKNDNMYDTLKLLSRHVSQLKNQKMATNIARLVSCIHSSTGSIQNLQHDSLADYYLKPIKSNNATETTSSSLSSLLPTSPTSSSSDNYVSLNKLVTKELQVSEEESSRDENVMALLNSDMRTALTSVLQKIISNSSSENSSDESEVIHHTNPGISIDQFLIILHHLQFTPLSVKNSRTNSGALIFCKFLDRDSDGFITLDDILTAQAMIMQRSETFLKIIFRMYIEACWYPGRVINYRNLLRSTIFNNSIEDLDLSAASPHPTSTPTVKGSVLSEDVLFNDVLDVPKFITAKNIANLFSRLGYDPTKANELFLKLVMIAEKEKKQNGGGKRLSNLSNPSSDFNPVPGRSETSSSINSNSEIENDIEIRDSLTPAELIQELDNKPKATDEINIDPVSLNTARLSLEDFILACRIDDVLIQAILRRPRRHVAKLISLAHQRAKVEKEHPPSYYIEQELLNAFNTNHNEEDNSDGRILLNAAAAVGRATLSAALGFASKFSLWNSVDTDIHEEEEDDDY